MKKRRPAGIQFKRTFVFLLAAVMILSVSSCKGVNGSPVNGQGQTDGTLRNDPTDTLTPPDTVLPPDTTQIPDDTLPEDDTNDPQIGYFPDGNLWTAVPMTSDSQAAADIGGGEGCQWPLFITFSETDGNLAFLGTDVGGLYRSVDGGKSWKQSTIGLGSEGATLIAIDPKNGECIYVGNARNVFASDMGLLFSDDGGKTWFNLTSTRDNIYPGDDGGREVQHLVIVPATRTLFAAGMCRGIYKMSLPSE